MRGCKPKLPKLPSKANSGCTEPKSITPQSAEIKLKALAGEAVDTGVMEAEERQMRLSALPRFAHSGLNTPLATASGTATLGPNKFC